DIVTRLQQLAVVDTKIFSQNLVNILLVRLHDLSGFRHRAHEATNHRPALGDDRPASGESCRGIGDPQIGTVNNVVITQLESLSVRRHGQNRSIDSLSDQRGQGLGRATGLNVTDFARVDAKATQGLDGEIVRIAADARTTDAFFF